VTVYVLCLLCGCAGVQCILMELTAQALASERERCLAEGMDGTDRLALAPAPAPPLCCAVLTAAVVRVWCGVLSISQVSFQSLSGRHNWWRPS
jgi:hypothetical protein